MGDRLKKSQSKITVFVDRINKRSKLYDEITKEINRRRTYAAELAEKDRLLRTRLIRNTEMKSAIQNLADIAEYKLDKAVAENIMENPNENNTSVIKIDDSFDVSDLNKEEFNTGFLLNNKKYKNNTSYAKYIQMAYAEVNQLLVKDKKILIEVIRNKINNDYKLKELEKLNLKVNSSLEKLKEFEIKLNDLINHDADMLISLKQIQNQSKSNSKDNEKIISLLSNYSKTDLNSSLLTANQSNTQKVLVTKS